MRTIIVQRMYRISVFVRSPRMVAGEVVYLISEAGGYRKTGSSLHARVL